MIMGLVVLLHGNGASIYQEKYPIGKKYEFASFFHYCML